MMHKQSQKALNLWIRLYKVAMVFIINIIKKPKMSQEFCDYIGSSSTLSARTVLWGTYISASNTPLAHAGLQSIWPLWFTALFPLEFSRAELTPLVIAIVDHNLYPAISGTEWKLWTQLLSFMGEIDSNFNYWRLWMVGGGWGCKWLVIKICRVVSH